MFLKIFFMGTAPENEQAGHQRNNTDGYGETKEMFDSGPMHNDDVTAYIAPGDRYYPEALLENWGRSAPDRLYCLGNKSLAKQPAIAVCGARNASETACGLSYTCGRMLSEKGIVTASGYARGIDMHAHRGAIDAGGDTIAILPYGIKKFRMQQLLSGLREPESIEEHMLVLSEFPVSMRFTVPGALKRNRCLVNIASAVIVVEPGETGGTWYTANYAHRKNRPLFYLEGTRGGVITKLEKIGGKRLPVVDNEPDLGQVFELIS